MYNITCVCIRCNGQKNHNTVNILEEQINATDTAQHYRETYHAYVSWCSAKCDYK